MWEWVGIMWLVFFVFWIIISGKFLLLYVIIGVFVMFLIVIIIRDFFIDDIRWMGYFFFEGGLYIFIFCFVVFFYYGFLIV